MNEKYNKYDVIIIGGGYAGCVNAICCARERLKVAIFEKNDKLCRKLLSTGNGRCNFSNEIINDNCYYSNSDIAGIIPKDSYKDSICFLNSIGVREKSINGYLYPYTNQAKTIRDAIEIAVSDLSLDVYFNTQVDNIVSQKESFIVSGCNLKFSSTHVVMATGSCAAPQIGGSDLGYKLANDLNIKLTDIHPALVGLLSNDSRLKHLSGVRCHGKVSWQTASFEGEIQFNKDGISGYPVMCLSRIITASLTDSAKLIIDFLPDDTTENIKKELTQRIINNGHSKSIHECMIGLLNDKCIDVILWDKHIAIDTPSSNITISDIDLIVKSIKSFSLKIKSSKGYESAQVAAGGVDLKQIDLITMESITYPNMYFIGEILDIDGICGGYNLEWARLSASRASKRIINKHNDSN